MLRCEALMHVEEVQARGRDAHGTLQALQVHRFESANADCASPPHASTAALTQAPSQNSYATIGVDAGWVVHCGVLMAETQ
jgi:hypothetical protein